MADGQTSRMIDITGKAPTLRTAAAEAEVHLNETARAALVAGTLPKGRAEDVARVAGIMAAKRCADLIPFCHPIGLNVAEGETERIEEGQRAGGADEFAKRPILVARGDGTIRRVDERGDVAIAVEGVEVGAGIHAAVDGH